MLNSKQNITLIIKSIPKQGEKGYVKYIKEKLKDKINFLD